MPVEIETPSQIDGFDSHQKIPFMRVLMENDSLSLELVMISVFNTLLMLTNLFVVSIINTWLLKAGGTSWRTSAHVLTSLVHWTRKTLFVKGACPSRLVGVGDIANQVGGVGPYLNIPKGERMKTSVKLEILESGDFVLDGLVVVWPPCTSSLT